MQYEVWAQYGTESSDCIHVCFNFEEATLIADRFSRKGYPDVSVMASDSENEAVWYTGYTSNQYEFDI
jgi:hypothetical protein